MHLEMGLVCNDEQFLYHAADYLRTVIKQSEPTYSECARPEPSLVYVDTPDPSPEDIVAWEAYWEECRAEDDELDDEED